MSKTSKPKKAETVSMPIQCELTKLRDENERMRAVLCAWRDIEMAWKDPANSRPAEANDQG